MKTETLLEEETWHDIFTSVIAWENSRVGGNFQPTRSPTQIWVVTRHQFGILRSFPRRHFARNRWCRREMLAVFSGCISGKLRVIEIKARKGCRRWCAGKRRRRDWEEVLKLPSLASESTPWSVRCLSSLLTVRRINYFTTFRWVVKNPPVSSNLGLTVNGACELSWQLTLDLHQLDGWTRPWDRPGIIFRAPQPHSVFK